MNGNYDVILEGQAVGKIQVSREGLYYHFCCRCSLETDTVCKILYGDIPIGILVPTADGFGLETRLPAKRFEGISGAFRVMPNRAVLGGRFVPIRPEEPFAYIERLKDAYLTIREGQPGIIIQEKAGM